MYFYFLLKYQRLHLLHHLHHPLEYLNHLNKLSFLRAFIAIINAFPLNFLKVCFTGVVVSIMKKSILIYFNLIVKSYELVFSLF